MNEKRARVMSFGRRSCPWTAGAVVLLFGATKAAAQSSSASPPHRRHHAIAFDPVLKRIVVFGGQQVNADNDAPLLDDLWSWNGEQGTQLAEHTGVKSVAHRLFVDAAGNLITVGGTAGVTARWAGASWSTVAADSTSRREMAGVAYDASRNRAIVFGGHIGGRVFPTGTWEFDGREWSRVAESGPPALLGGSMAYDARRKVTVLFGGLEPAGKKLGSTWEWDGRRWTRVPVEGPSPRFGAGMTYDEARGEIILFGGVDSANVKLADTWRWNGDVWRRVEASEGPSPRSEGHMAYDAARRVVVLFGGEGVQMPLTLGDTWEWNGVRWTRMR